jgi:hypothetical protein
MSAFGSYKGSSSSSAGGSDKRVRDEMARGGAAEKTGGPTGSRAGAKRPAGGRSSKAADGADDDLWLPADDEDGADPALSTLIGGGMAIDKKKPVREPANLETEDCDYIREQCLVPSERLRRFGEVVGARVARCFAEQYRPVSSGATRALSGLLLFGPSGTGKSLLAQAITSYIGGTFYKFSAADLPNSTNAMARRVDALFDVALGGSLPAVIFIDECDTVLSARAAVRVGHFAGRFERFTDNLLVIGATNEPDQIAPKILTGRFERKIFVDNPSSNARRAMIQRQLAEEISEHALSPADLDFIVEQTAGRSAVNMERLISSAAIKAACAPVTRDEFVAAIEEEPSDFDRAVAAKNAKFDAKHGWHPA